VIEGDDPVKIILIDMMQMCWVENPGSRPTFAQISAKIISLF